MDRNAWSRRNRWYHIDVINSTAGYLTTIPIADQTQRAQRPIIEFDPDIQLFNHGSVAKDAVAYIDFENITNARETIENYPTDNALTATISLANYDFTLSDGDRIIFAADSDILVRNKIYIVNIINIKGDNETADWRVHLTPGYDTDVAANSSVLASKALYLTSTQEAIQYWFDGNIWYYGQQKTDYNQFPQFDIFNENNISISDKDLYVNSSFKGTHLFAYKIGTGSRDPVLGFQLSYRSFQNVGDIEFENDFDNDTFTYEQQGTVEEPVNQYFLRQNLAESAYQFRNVWVQNTETTKQFQVFNYKFTGDTNYFTIDIDPAELSRVPTMIVYVNNKVLDPTSYVITSVGEIKTVRISIARLAVGDLVTIRIYSSSVSRIGHYEVPLN